MNVVDGSLNTLSISASSVSEIYINQFWKIRIQIKNVHK
jgi:hypothetical protein